MAIWPAELPGIMEVSGFDATPLNQTIRSDMEVGPARVRRRTVTRLDSLNGQMTMTASELRTLRDWIDDGVDGLAGGVNWFTGLGLLTGTTESTVDYTLSCRLMGPIKFSAISGVLLLVRFSLEVRDA